MVIEFYDSLIIHFHVIFSFYGANLSHHISFHSIWSLQSLQSKNIGENPNMLKDAFTNMKQVYQQIN